MAAFGIAWLASIILTMHPASRLSGLNLYSYSYIGIIMAWAFLIRKRIVNDSVRKYLLMASGMMVGLFVVRICRWDFFQDVPIVNEYAWYAYYVCFTAVPLCAFLAALCVGKPASEGPPRVAGALWAIQIILDVIFFTNPLHGLMFRNVDMVADTYDYGIGYYFCVAWGVTLGLAASAVIIARCRVSASRKMWYLPVIGMGIGMGLLVLYYANGGSPHIGAFRLYHVHEAFCLTVIAPFEAMIQTGILPSNSCYELFFRNGSMKAAILDKEGNPVFWSRDYGKAECGEHEKICEQEIHGGKVTWREDLTEIRFMENRLIEVTEQLADENELIRQENEIRAERIGYETKNRLYDKIAGAVREQAKAIRDELQDKPEEERLLEKLPRVAIWGAYVKRMGNIMILADQEGAISVQELGSAIRESLDGLALLKRPGSITVKGEENIPAPLVVLAYGAVEAVLEAGMEDADNVAIYIHVDREKGFEERIETDGKERPIPEGWKERELKRAGAEMTVLCSEGIWNIRLTAGLSSDEKEVQG